MPIATDPLSLFFVGCFLFGMLFLIVTALLGNLGHGHGGTDMGAHHAPMHLGGHVGGAHGVGHTASHAPAHTAAHTTGTQSAGDKTTQAGNISSILSYLNISTIVYFLIGFGLLGYIFHNTLQFVALLTLSLAGVSGIIVTALLILLLNRLFGNSEGETVQDVSDRTGMVGKVSMTIQENSLGEVLYISPGGLRKSVPARSIDGRRLERDQEVVIVNYQQGIAEVDTWEHFIGEEQSHSTATAPDVDELATLRALLDEPEKTDTELVVRKDLQKE